ncbi:YtxH domain-containing protein [Candidatus Nitrospira bockiana]
MSDEERAEGISGTAVMLAFLAGAAIGGIAALLLAPQSGRESREQVRSYARKTGESLKDLADKAGETWQAAREKGREFVHEQSSVLKEALDAGRDAIRRQREHTEQRSNS